MDVLKLSDAVASEFASFPGIAVVPVNTTLAALALDGCPQVSTAHQAVELARRLGADATVTVGVTEYDPYDPPVVGMVMQWYAPPERWHTRDPGSADSALAAGETEPVIQIQRVFNADREEVRDDVRRFAGSRSVRDSPGGWRTVLRSQDLFVRYCCWSLIRSIQSQVGVTEEDARSN